MDVVETQSSNIVEKVFKLSDIRKLALLMHNEFEDIKKYSEYAENYARLSYTVSYENNSKSETKDVSFFNDNSDINLKRVTGVDMSIKSYSNPHRCVDISVAHKTHDYSSGFNEINITGDDRNWVLGTFSKVNEVISSVPPQNKFIFRNKKIIELGISFLMGLSIFYTLYVLLIFFDIEIANKIVPNFDGNFLRIFFNFFIVLYFTLSIGYLLSIPFRRKIETLWPFVEIQIGPEHELIEKRRRSYIGKVVVLFLIPLLMMFLGKLV